MKNKVFIIAALTALSAFLQFGNIQWGTPNWRRNLLVFSSKEELQGHVPRMIALRDAYYSKREKIFEEKGKVKLKQIEQSMLDTWGHSEKSKPFGIIPKEVVLDFSRAYFINVNLSDEAHAIFPLASMNPKKLDLDPKNYIYGGFYYYTVASSLVAAKLAGIISLTKDTGYYFLHPEETTRIYTIVRGIGALFSVLSVVLLYIVVAKFFNGVATPALACLFLAISPLVSIHSHLSKPHALSMFLLLAGLYFILKIFTAPGTKYYALGGVFLGLSAGALITNLSFILIIFIAHFIKEKRFSFRSRGLWFGVFFFFLAFLSTNYFLLLHPERFLRFILHQKIYSGYGIFNASETFKFIHRIFTWGDHWTVLPLFAAGMSVLLYGNNPAGKIISIFGLIFFASNAIFLRHQGVWSIGYPVIAICLSAAIIHFLKVLNRPALKTGVLLYAAIVVFFMLARSLHYANNLFVIHGNFTAAGEWINENIPGNSRVGIPTGWALPGTMPAFNFLKYKLVNVPLEKETWQDSRGYTYPEYIIVPETYKGIAGIEHFNKIYSEIISWPGVERFLGIRFPAAFVPSENVGVKIFKRGF